MNKFSLKIKIFLMLIPLILGLVGSSILITLERFPHKGTAERVLLRTEGFIAASELIHELQIERGKSGLFLNSKISKDDLLEQQKKVDVLFKAFSTKLAIFKDKSYDEFSLEIEKAILESRKAIERTDFKLAFNNYSKTVADLIKLQSISMESVSFNGVEGAIRSLVLFESSKEGMGRLRGSLTATFAGNIKKELRDRDLMQSYVNEISINLESPALQVSLETRNAVRDILEGAGWKSVLKDFLIFSEKYQSGDYGVDAKAFSEAITAQINMLNELLKREQLFQFERLQVKLKSITNDLISISIFTLAFIIFTIVFSFYITKNLAFQIEKISHTMNSSSEDLVLVVNEIVTASENLSSAATEQAAAIQETSASIEEISSMINVGTERVGQSASLSENNLRSVETGKKEIEQMVLAVEAIGQSNHIISEHANTTNVELGKIIKIIEELGSKIKVINDIVFQTKLLSFNASVEAARAGEHGKGFAVVAEEVGNLAQMSGDSAKDISEILDTSTKTVNAIINSTKERMTNILKQSEQKIKDGINCADSCKSIFDEIYSNTQTITQMTAEISQASTEQAQGVSEVNKAIAQLDQATQVIAKNAQSIVSISSNVSIQSDEVSQAAEELNLVISGNQAVPKFIHQNLNVNSAQGFSLESAIEAHSAWKNKLVNYLKNPDGSLKEEVVCKDDQCPLGKWIYGDGQQFNYLEAYEHLKSNHATFHLVAGEIVKKINQRQTVVLEDVIGKNSQFREVSTKTITSIRDMRMAINNLSSGKNTLNHPKPEKDNVFKLTSRDS